MFLSGTNTGLRVSPVNPAIATFMTITFNNSTEGWKSIWIFLIFGFAGSFAAFIFFRFIYKTTADTIYEIEEDEREQEELAAMDKSILEEDTERIE